MRAAGVLSYRRALLAAILFLAIASGYIHAAYIEVGFLKIIYFPLNYSGLELN